MSELILWVKTYVNVVVSGVLVSGSRFLKVVADGPAVNIFTSIFHFKKIRNLTKTNFYIIKSFIHYNLLKSILKVIPEITPQWEYNKYSKFVIEKAKIHTIIKKILFYYTIFLYKE